MLIEFKPKFQTLTIYKLSVSKSKNASKSPTLLIGSVKSNEELNATSSYIILTVMSVFQFFLISQIVEI